MTLPEPDGRTETEWRRDILRGYMIGGLLFAQVQFDPHGTPFHPAVNGTPTQVAAWLRQLAGDVEGLP